MKQTRKWLKRALSISLAVFLGFTALVFSPRAAEEDIQPQWLVPGHNSINNEVLGANHPFMWRVNTVSARLDRYPFRGGDRPHTARYHGGENYVATLWYLFAIARGYLHTPNYTHIGFRPTFITNTAHVEGMERDITALFTEFSATTQELRAWTVMGMIFHLVADIYAHRTIVPVDVARQGLYSGGGFHATRFRASEFPGVSIWNRLLRVIFQFDFSHTCGGIFTNRVPRDDASIMNDMLRGSQAERRRGCWACTRRAIELQVLEFRDIKHVIENRDTVVTFPDGTRGPVWHFYEDYIGAGGFHAPRVRQSVFALQHVVNAFVNNGVFSSYWLVPSNVNNPRSLADELVLDFIVDYTRVTMPDAGWLQQPRYFARSTFWCNGGPNTTCGNTELHYVIYPTYMDAFHRRNALQTQGAGRLCNRRPTAR